MSIAENSFIIEDKSLIVKIPEDKIPQLIKTLVSNNVDIFSVERKKSLEDYFLKITEEN
jgi:hypothetical protein